MTSAEEMENHLGRICGRDSLLGRRALRWNGVETRHYALDAAGAVTASNACMCAAAVTRALDAARLEQLQPDVPRRRDHSGRLPGPRPRRPGAWRARRRAAGDRQLPIGLRLIADGGQERLAEGVRAQEHAAAAAACAGEFSSRWFRPAFYEGGALVDAKGRLAAEADYLRFTLSDGAGAVVMEPPAPGRAASA